MALKSLALVTVAAAGTPVRSTINETVPAARYGVQSFTVFALAANSGANIYVGNSVMVKATGVGVYAIVPKGGAGSVIISESPAGFNMADIYLDADTNGDKALVSCTEQ